MRFKKHPQNPKTSISSHFPSFLFFSLSLSLFRRVCFDFARFSRDFSKWRILKDDASEQKGELARMSTFVGAIAILDLIKTTLGPKGMDKILQSTGQGHNVTVTNDGATIMKSLHIDNPAAKVLIEISKTQDDEVGDGTTSVVVLAGELLREAEKLIAMKIHLMTIISGYRMASECAHQALLKKVVDNKQDSDKFRLDLMNIAMTTLSSKILAQDEELFANMAVDAAMRLKGSTNLEAIQIIKSGGLLRESFLDEGYVYLEKICGTKAWNILFIRLVIGLAVQLLLCIRSFSHFRCICG